MENTLYYGDNLDILKRYVKDESVDLVYLDPPFNSNANYNVLFAEKDGSKAASQIQAFTDTWTWSQDDESVYAEIVTAGGRVADSLQAFRTFLGPCDMLAYLVMMAPRLVELRRVMKPTASIYLHCDQTANSYLRLLLDAIFEPQCFRREIIWSLETVSGYKSTANNWIRCHDTLLFYVKSNSAITFNKLYLPHKSEYIARFKKTDPNGRKYRDDRSEGRIQYLDETPGRAIGDVWNDIMSFQQAATSSEILGYPTQKPQVLLERIINASSNENDVVLDPFCGCGTTIAAAQRLARIWIGIDITHLAITLIKTRLKDSFGESLKFNVIGEPTSLQDASALAESDPYQFQWWALGLVGARPVEQKKGSDKGIDGRIIFQGEKQGVFESVIISVKAGHINVAHVRDLKGVLDREKAAIGVLISMEDPSKPMQTEAITSGFYESINWNKKYPKVQLLTVADLLAGKQIEMPPQRQLGATFKKAPKADEIDKQKELF